MVMSQTTDRRRNKLIEKGDSVTIDVGVHYADYWSDLTRTFFVGDPDPQFKTIYQTVLDAQKSAIDRIHPGAPFARSIALPGQ
jgi:Xaa-Pro aminopeptidase